MCQEPRTETNIYIFYYLNTSPLKNFKTLLSARQKGETKVEITEFLKNDNEHTI